MKCKDLYCKVFQNETYKNVLLTRETAFTEFISENLHFSDTYRGREKLTEACNKYDCFILGSDQVWNPMNLGGDFYTMTFVPDEIKKSHMLQALVWQKFQITRRKRQQII